MNFASRIAPTPSGFLHIGNVYSFLLTRAVVRKHDGKLLLRIDDLDSVRVQHAYVNDIFETLQFMGIHYDAGPKNATDFFDNYSQQLRLLQYDKLLLQLINTGLVYACTCSRKAYATSSISGDPCLHKKLSLDTPNAAWRIHTPPNSLIQFDDEYLGPVGLDLHKSMPDFIIKRKDGIPSYQVASLCDDISYNINFIVRGHDLLTSSAAQLYLARLIDNPLFLNTTFYHHPLIKNNNDKKLSKSAGSQSIQNLRSMGMQVADILKLLEGLPGMSSEKHLQSINDIEDNL